MNTLIVALSIFNPHSRDSLYRFCCPMGEFTVPGTQTNEPVPRVLLQMLHTQGDTLDRIIMLCTKETLQQPVANGQNTAQYFENSVRSFAIEQGLPFAAEFSAVPINEMPSAQDILTASMQIIACLRQEDAEDIGVYVDATGGFRDAVMSIISTLQLMKEQNIRVKDILYTNYNLHADSPYQIVSRAGAYEVFDLVSGIDELKNYGSTKKLVEYYKDGGLTRRQQKILDALSTVYEEIQLCRISQSKAALDRLALLLGNYSDTDQSTFSAIVKTAREKYAGITGDMTYFDYIKWCYKNRYISQVLALICETMPGILTDRQILQVSKTVQDICRDRSVTTNRDRGWSYYFVNTYLKKAANPQEVDQLRLYSEQLRQIKAGKAEKVDRRVDEIWNCVNFLLGFQKGLQKPENAPKALGRIAHAFLLAKNPAYDTKEKLLQMVNPKDLYTQLINCEIALRCAMKMPAADSTLESPESKAAMAMERIRDTKGVHIHPAADPAAVQQALEDYYYLRAQRNSVLHVGAKSDDSQTLYRRIQQTIANLEGIFDTMGEQK